MMNRGLCLPLSQIQELQKNGSCRVRQVQYPACFLRNGRAGVSSGWYGDEELHQSTEYRRATDVQSRASAVGPTES